MKLALVNSACVYFWMILLTIKLKKKLFKFDLCAMMLLFFFRFFRFYFIFSFFSRFFDDFMFFSSLWPSGAVFLSRSVTTVCSVMTQFQTEDFFTTTPAELYAVEQNVANWN